jgi:hypothetical protein
MTRVRVTRRELRVSARSANPLERQSIDATRASQAFWRSATTNFSKVMYCNVLHKSSYKSSLSLLYAVKILVSKYKVEPMSRCNLMSSGLPGEEGLHTTELVIAANERMNIRYPFVRDTPMSGLKVLDESEPERIRSKSTPWGDI